MFSGGIFESNGSSYHYSLQRTYQFREELVSYRLSQIYYVSPHTLRDFRFDGRLKYQLDEKVERDVLQSLEKQCNMAKQRRQQFL